MRIASHKQSHLFVVEVEIVFLISAPGRIWWSPTSSEKKIKNPAGLRSSPDIAATPASLSVNCNHEAKHQGMRLAVP